MAEYTVLSIQRRFQKVSTNQAAKNLNSLTQKLDAGYVKAGTGYLAGKLTGASPISPAYIRIHWRPTQGTLGDGKLVAMVAVDAAGNWRVDNLNTSMRYDVVARRAGYNDVITANVQPLPM